MKYIVYQRFRGKAICGENMNLPYGTEAESNEDGLIFVKGKPVCYTTSQNGHMYFARNDDGYGLRRGAITHSISKTLQKTQNLWDKVWDDKVCQQYKRPERKDFWLWNHDFYNADIEDLRHIAALVGAKEG